MLLNNKSYSEDTRGLVMKCNSIVAITIANSLLLCAASHASASSLVPVPLTPGDNSGGFDLVYAPGCLCLPVTDQQQVTGPSTFSNTLSGLGLGGSISGSLTVTNSPTPSINASATLSGVAGNPPAGGSVSLGAVTNYSMEILGPTPTVSLLVNALGGVGFNSSPTSSAILLSFLQIRAANNGPVILSEFHQLQSSTVSSDGFTVASDFTFSTNTLYDVRLQVGLSDSISGAGTHSMFAFVDPTFSIDDPNSGAYSLLFSEGFGGASLVATPLPAALPLFGTGLGVIGLLGWRKKRKAALAA